MNERPSRVETRVLLGAVAGAHGIRGEVKVKTFTETPEGLAAYGPLTTESGRTLRIAQLRPVKAGEAVVRFEGVSDRNAAEALKGAQLFVDRAALPETEANEFYIADLIGLPAVNASGTTVGTVTAVHDFGAGDVLEIALLSGETEYVPFTDDTVPAVDIEAKRVIVRIPQYDEDEP